MNLVPGPAQESTASQQEDRLGSWKAIAAYVKRDVTTVQRWEKREGMPVRRHQHGKRGSVYAFRSELDTWMASRGWELAAERPATARGPLTPATLVAFAALLVAIGLVWWFRRDAAADSPLPNARVLPLTDFEGVEQ